jgi:hypothetical protein
MDVGQDLLFISVLNILLVPFSCDWQGRFIYRRTIDRNTGRGDRSGMYRGRMLYFPERSCYARSNLVHQVIGAVTAMLHILLGK